MSDVPSLDVFKRHQRSGGWTALVLSLEPNCPKNISADVPSTTSNKATMFREAARRNERKVVIRTVDGVVWACWVTDEVAS